MSFLSTNLALRRSVLGKMIGAGGDYETMTLKTIKEPFSPGPNTVTADLDAIESDYDGYAAITPVVWGNIFDDPSGSAAVLGGLVQWDCTGSTTPQDVYGVYWVNAGGVLKGVEILDTPLPARAAFDAIPYIPRLTFGQ